MASQLHALVIDDNAMNLDVLQKLLSLENVTSTAVLDPSDLTQTLNDIPGIDIVFLDLEMPSTNGYDILEFLKKQIGLTAPIVACTVHISEASTARELGFDSFLAKPLNADVFSEQFKRIMRGERVWAIRTN